MASWLAKRQAPMLPSGTSSTNEVARFEGRGGATSETRFVPASWLVLLFELAWTTVTRRKIAKVGVASFIWLVTPKALKLLAAGVVLTWVLVVAGALAAITLLALQIS